MHSMTACAPFLSDVEGSARLPEPEMMSADLSTSTPASVQVEGEDYHKAEVELRVPDDVILMLLSLHASAAVKCAGLHTGILHIAKAQPLIQG
jgi:hypothetical protein